MRWARALIRAGVVAGAVFFMTAAYANDTTDQFGTALRGNVGRTVDIDASTRFIRVEHLEKLTIRNRAGLSFAWHFDTFYAPTGFPLSSIASPEFDAGSTWVYVRPCAPTLTD